MTKEQRLVEIETTVNKIARYQAETLQLEDRRLDEIEALRRAGVSTIKDEQEYFQIRRRQVLRDVKSNGGSR